MRFVKVVKYIENLFSQITRIIHVLLIDFTSQIESKLNTVQGYCVVVFKECQWNVLTYENTEIHVPMFYYNIISVDLERNSNKYVYLIYI